MNHLTKLTALMGIALLFACSNAEKDWNKAVKKNTAQAFESFIQKYPESNLMDKANEKLLSLQADGIYQQIFTHPKEEVEIVGPTKVIMTDMGVRNGSKQFGSTRYVEYNDTNWVLHFKLDAYYSNTVRFEEDYVLKGTLIRDIEYEPKPELVQRMDSVPDIYRSLISSFSEEEQVFATSDSIFELFRYRNKFTPEIYNSLIKVYLLNHEYVTLNNYFGCVSDQRSSIGGQATMSVLVDSLYRVNRAIRPNIQYSFDENKILDLEENAKREEVIVTESGLQYEIIKEGDGEKPVESSTVEVHYEGVLADGKMFDSSYERDESISFPLGQVIKGWQEGLKLMSTGSTYVLYIPSELGYGSQSGGPIPANSTLIFIVELLKVEN